MHLFFKVFCCFFRADAGFSAFLFLYRICCLSLSLSLSLSERLRSERVWGGWGMIKVALIFLSFSSRGGERKIMPRSCTVNASLKLVGKKGFQLLFLFFLRVEN